ncbi:hypothetical protein PVS_33 [Vibrio phage vB_VspS_VS-ABTNL-3]|nr:hypothetical protein PVS_33 [Vibrio phage vB_VspS_VS-ABTNL-3]
MKEQAIFMPGDIVKPEADLRQPKAWGVNIILRVKNTAYSPNGIVQNSKGQPLELEPSGFVYSTGQAVRNAEELQGKEVRFTSGMVQDVIGTEADEWLLVTVHEGAILSVF